MKIYGLTGGIGSGKSTVSQLFEKAGWPVIYVDRLNMQAAKRPDIEKWIFDRFGTLNRLALRRIIYQDAIARKEMEDKMRPEVGALLAVEIGKLAYQGVPQVVVECAVIFEFGIEGMFDKIINVECKEEKRMERILQRDHMDEEIARNIMACQLSEHERRKRSHHTIRNEGSLEDLEVAFNFLLQEI